MSAYDEVTRSDLRKMLVANQVEASRAAQIVHLACHAADSAFEALSRVIQTAPDSGSGLMALEIALQLASARFRGTFERTHALGRSMGCPQHVGAVGMPG